MDNLETAVVRVTGNDDAEAVQLGMSMSDMARMGSFRLPRVDENFAEDEDVRQNVSKNLAALVDWIRRDRMVLESEWRAIMRMEWMLHDDGRKYIGRTNAYVPLFARIHQTMVSSLSRGLFPSDEYMDVMDRSATPNLDFAKATKTYLQWEFERIGQVRRRIKPFLRTLDAFGSAPLKFWYDKEPRPEEGRLRKTAGIIQPHFSQRSNYEGLRVSPRNLFNWYIYPYTAESMDDAVLVFEDINVPRDWIRERVERKEWLNGAQALNAPEPDTHQTNESVRLTSLLGLSVQQASPAQGSTIGAQRTITECWTYLRLPKRAYMDGEDPSCAVPVKVVLAGNVPVEVRRNPHWHQRAPYLYARMNAMPGLIYGFGTGRMVRHLQYLTNDFTNQTADCGNYALNPIKIINPHFLAGPLKPISPGVAWYTSDVTNGIKFEHPPLELIGSGLNMVEWLQSQGMDLGGTPPITQGTSASGSAKTATGAQLLQHNAMQPLQDLVEDLELDVMVPLMYGTWVNAQQYRDEAVMTMVSGAPLKIEREMLMIDPEMRYLASSQSMNQAQRAQQLLAYLQNLMGAIPVLQQTGTIVNPLSLYKRVLTDGFGLRLPPDLFITMPGGPASMMNMNAQNPMGTDPNVMQAQENATRSAVQQANGIPDPSAVGMEPGEGGAFGDVRDNADSLAAMMGGSNGK